MAEDRPGLSTGLNSRPLNDTIAETGGGIPDDAVMEGELGPGELGDGADAAIAALERKGWVKGEDGEDVLAETEGQPS